MSDRPNSTGTSRFWSSTTFVPDTIHRDKWPLLPSFAWTVVSFLRSDVTCLKAAPHFSAVCWLVWEAQSHVPLAELWEIIWMLKRILLGLCASVATQSSPEVYWWVLQAQTYPLPKYLHELRASQAIHSSTVISYSSVSTEISTGYLHETFQAWHADTHNVSQSLFARREGCLWRWERMKCEPASRQICSALHAQCQGVLQKCWAKSYRHSIWHHACFHMVQNVWTVQIPLRNMKKVRREQPNDYSSRLYERSECLWIFNLQETKDGTKVSHLALRGTSY